MGNRTAGFARCMRRQLASGRAGCSEPRCAPHESTFGMRNATLFPALERALGPGALGALGEAFKKATEAKANGTERGVGPLVLLCYVESTKTSSNFRPQQWQKPIHRSNHGRILLSVCSHVTPEVFFGAQVDDRDE